MDSREKGLRVRGNSVGYWGKVEHSPQGAGLFLKTIQNQVRPNHHVLVLYCTLLHSPFDEFSLLSIRGTAVIESGTDRHKVGEGCRREAVLFSVHYAVFTGLDT